MQLGRLQEREFGTLLGLKREWGMIWKLKISHKPSQAELKL